MLVLSHFELKKNLYEHLPENQQVHRDENSDVWRFCAVLYDCSTSECLATLTAVGEVIQLLGRQYIFLSRAALCIRKGGDQIEEQALSHN